ncbi:MAG TPA: sigma-70 family RNA polymerase sigma factor [Burkholderiales bacterium]|nr:sigma-70 family RNA polymerase sigma factor [Burkholderiales bacterium]
MKERDSRTAEAVLREGRRLRNFIRRRVPDPMDAEDILQDVFFAFFEACRLPEPLEETGAWLFRVARNRIIDRFRRKQREPFCDEGNGEEDSLSESAAPSEDGPEALFARKALLEELDRAFNALPQAQREVFLAHELEGKSFRELALESGLPLNTLLARKRYAVLGLRIRLKEFYRDFEF